VQEQAGAANCRSGGSRDSLGDEATAGLGLWRALLLVSLVALTAACGGGTKPDEVAAVPVGPDPAAIAAHQQALALLEAGDEPAAVARLQALSDAYPDYSGPLVNLALIRSRRDENTDALALLERAVRVCDHCAPAWNELGILQRRAGRFAEAEQSYLKAIAADPAYGNAHFNLAVLYELYLQRPELALDQYARFREVQAEDPAGGDVDKWMADLKRRVGAVERSAKAEEPS
jgi:tetratricopeptide (TPR) repeat protein